MFRLDTGPERGWEVNNVDQQLKSVTESHVLAFTLSKSRERWLTSVLPKLSGKGKKGPKSAIAPPSHSLYSRGGCDLQIGPHVFSDTTIYEAHYHPTQVSGLSQSLSTPSTAPESAQISQPLPALADQINEAAASNPTLASLLQLAVAGNATAEQLAMLSITIQSLSNPGTVSQYIQLNAQSGSPPGIALYAAPAVTRKFDLIVEFRESPSDRFILPRGTTVCERVASSGDIVDIVLTSYVQLQSKELSGTSAGENDSIMPRIIRMTLRGASASIWDTLNRWVGGEEKMKANRMTLDKLKREQPRKSYLAYRLPAGPLVDQLRVATSPSGPYMMKHIKPSAISRPRRVRKTAQKDSFTMETDSLASSSSTSLSAAKPTRRKRSVTETDDNTSSAMNLAAVITGAASSTKYSPNQKTLSRPPSTSIRRSAAVSTDGTAASPASSTSVTGRQRLIVENRSRPLTAIKCRSCEATDVPLMLGGRFCRTCVEAGLASGDIPQPPNYASRGPTSYTPSYIPPPMSVAAYRPSLPISEAQAAAVDVSYAPYAINLRPVGVSTGSSTDTAHPH